MYRQVITNERSGITHRLTVSRHLLLNSQHNSTATVLRQPLRKADVFVKTNKKSSVWLRWASGCWPDMKWRRWARRSWKRWVSTFFWMEWFASSPRDGCTPARRRVTSTGYIIWRYTCTHTLYSITSLYIHFMCQVIVFTITVKVATANQLLLTFLFHLSFDLTMWLLWPSRSAAPHGCRKYFGRCCTTPSSTTPRRRRHCGCGHQSLGWLWRWISVNDTRVKLAMQIWIT